ncbi:SWIM zinc finger family protein [Candidatus Contendibacter odensensis]|uniref:Zinc finger SWIM domain protein n=1 Tax=Candidatus Contendobacter odensis Run_B_J11 TaxID=1400861 RepID=A0A7U7GDC8_9GAMM|nr:SWIM zinc finger family protein [Candidatus Contendobacter odensis]CDH46272.1 putative Zinc finger SWIM domain protein [Candidatus Contendobacter odensis Run_B_J11]
MSSPTFDTTLLHEYASNQSIQRGREYFQEGAVGALVLRGHQLQADVAGSQPRPYRVEIEFNAEDVAEACCSCPYNYGGWCKHIIAVLLTYAEQPDQVEVRSPLIQRLAALERAQLQSLVLELVERVPRLVDLVETALTLLERAPDTLASNSRSVNHATTGTTPRPPVPVNIRALRQQTHNLLRSQSGHWDNGYDNEEDVVSPDLMELVEQSRPFLDAGDGRAALDILEAVTDEVRKRWDVLEEVGLQPYDFVNEITSFWVEALLDPALSAEERQRWIQTLAAWEESFNSEGSYFIAAAQAAAQQGWDDPALNRILQGETVPGGLWGDEQPQYADNITQARLRILARTGQDEAYLNLSRAEKHHDLYALHLLKLDRVQEAIAVGLEQPLDQGERLELAQALYQRGEIEAAFQVAEQGLQQSDAVAMKDPLFSRVAEQMDDFDLCDSYPQGALSAWVRDRAIEQGQTERALAAGIIAFREIPRSTAYRQLETLAGAGWPDLQLKLLEFLRTATCASTETKVEIFLRETLLDDAIQAVESHYTASETLARVMDAAIKQRPEWVIAQARQQAEPIMDGGQSAHYEDAAKWLRKAKQAYEALGQKTEWRTYLGALCEKHQRKYKLMPLLRML